MSIYSCYLVTHAAMEQFNLSNIPDEWFNWRFVHTPLGHDESVTLKRIEIVDSSQSDRVQEWYTQVTAAGLASTLIRTTYEGNEAFPLTATDPWGGGADLFLGMMIPGDKDEIAGWISHLSQPDELAVLGWVGHRLGGGGDRSRYFNRVPNFAHCYANELKRWIACPGNAELLAEQWDDVRGWPEDTPSLTVEDFAWDRKRWDDERTKLWVPMLRLPFCEIGFTHKPTPTLLTSGLLPDQAGGTWQFDHNGAIQTALREIFYENQKQSACESIARVASNDAPNNGWFQKVIEFIHGTVLMPAPVLGLATTDSQLTQYPVQTFLSPYGTVSIEATQRGSDADCKIHLILDSTATGSANLEVKLNDSEWHPLTASEPTEVWLASTKLSSTPITVTVQDVA